MLICPKTLKVCENTGCTQQYNCYNKPVVPVIQIPLFKQ